MSFDQKNIGVLLIAFSVVLIVLLSLTKTNVDEQAAFLCDAVHANPDLEMDDCPVHQSNTSWLLIIAFGVSFLILGSGAYMRFMPVKSGVKVDTGKFDSEEKKVYDILKKHEGSVYQSDIMKELDLSKVKVTRILDKLESKKVIERKRRGMTNIVVLK